MKDVILTKKIKRKYKKPLNMLNDWLYVRKSSWMSAPKSWMEFNVKFLQIRVVKMQFFKKNKLAMLNKLIT